MAHPLIELCFTHDNDDGFVGRSSGRRPDSASRAAQFADLATLAQQIRDGSERAFEQLFHQTYPRLIRLATALIGGDAAADVVTEVFVTVWATRSTWAPVDVEAFLYRSVRNRALNTLRTDVRERTRRDVYSESLERTSALIDLGDDDPRAVAVRAAVAELNPRQREFVVLRWQEGRTAAEIAVLLGVTVRAVTSLQDRTLAVLRRRVPELFSRLS